MDPQPSSRADFLDRLPGEFDCAFFNSQAFCSLSALEVFVAILRRADMHGPACLYMRDAHQSTPPVVVPLTSSTAFTMHLGLQPDEQCAMHISITNADMAASVQCIRISVARAFAVELRAQLLLASHCTLEQLEWVRSVCFALQSIHTYRCICP